MNKSIFWEHLVQVENTESSLTQVLNNIAGAAKGGTLVATGVSVGIQILLGGSLMLFWSLVNSI